VVTYFLILSEHSLETIPQFPVMSDGFGYVSKMRLRQHTREHKIRGFQDFLQLHTQTPSFHSSQINVYEVCIKLRHFLPDLYWYVVCFHPSYWKISFTFWSE
jgi:hypothetical protein